VGVATAFTSTKTYVPLEFFMTVLAMDMIALPFGQHAIKEFFKEIHEASHA
jgi:hypothetical protein